MLKILSKIQMLKLFAELSNFNRQFFQKAQDNSNNENVVQENLPAIQPEEEKVKPKEDPLDIPKFLVCVLLTTNK